MVWYGILEFNVPLDGWGMDIGFVPTWLCQVPPLLHMTTLTTEHAFTLLQ